MLHDSLSIERKTLNFKDIEIDVPLEHEMVEENEIDELNEHETEDELTSDDSSEEPNETSPREYSLAPK